MVRNPIAIDRCAGPLRVVLSFVDPCQRPPGRYGVFVFDFMGKTCPANLFALSQHPGNHLSVDDELARTIILAPPAQRFLVDRFRGRIAPECIDEIRRREFGNVHASQDRFDRGGHKLNEFVDAIAPKWLEGIVVHAVVATLSAKRR